MDQKTDGADGFSSVRPLTPEELAAIGGGSIASDIASAANRVAFWAGAIAYSTVALMAGMAKPKCE
jgi:hypothetical protein